MPYALVKLWTWSNLSASEDAPTLPALWTASVRLDQGVSVVGVQFANGIFAVIAPIAAALPIIIHLLALRRRRYVAFTMLRLLESAALQASGMRRLREWLIVLARSLAVLFLFIALSRPLIRGVRLTALSDTSVCILVDDTPSMSFLDGSKSRFETARECAEELIRSLPNARFCIISLSRPDEVVCNWTSEASEAMRKLKGMRVKSTQGSVKRALLKALEMFKLVSGTGKCLFIFTDGQVIPSLCGAARHVRESASNLMDGQLNVAIVDVRQSLSDVNVAPVDWDVDVTCLSSPPSAVLRFTLRNFGSRSWRGTVSVAVDDKPAAELSDVTIAPRGELSLAIPISLGFSGWHRGLVKWRDALPIDNQLHFAFYNPLPIRVLCVGSWQQEGSSAFYIAKALESIRECAGTNSIVIDRSLSIPQSANELKRWHVLIWCCPRPMAKSSEAALRSWLLSGGTLIAFVDRHAVDAPRWLFPVRADGGKSSAKPLCIFLSDASHPISRRIPSEQLSDVLVFERTVADEALSGTVILRFDDGSPALTEKGFGLGRAIVMWMGADTRASTMPTSIAFVPLLCELLQYAVMQSHAVVKLVGSSGVKIEVGKTSSLSSMAIVSNADVSDSDTRIPSHDELRRLAAKVYWSYVALDEWRGGQRIEMPVNATVLFITLCVAMLLVEAMLEIQWVRQRRR